MANFGKLPRVVELPQMPEMSACLKPLQGMLNVPRYRRVDVEPRRLVVPEGRVFSADVGMVETPIPYLERTSEFNVFVYVVSSKQPLMLPKRYECSVQQLRTVVEFLMRGKPESERIRS